MAPIIVLLSFFLSIVLPAIFTFFTNYNFVQGVDSEGSFVYIYLSLVLGLILLCSLKNIIFLKKNYQIYLVERAESFTFPHRSSSAIFTLVLIVYLVRIYYYLLISESPYVDLTDALIDNNSVPYYSLLIKYIYVTISFKFISLFQAFVVFNLSKRVSIFFCFLELLYGLIIYSKLLVFSAILLIIIIYFFDRISSIKITTLLKVSFFSFVLFVLFGSLRLVFGYLRSDVDFDFIDINLLEVVVFGLGRFQSLSSLFYVDQVVDGPLNGTTFCHIIGYLVPDSLINIPYHCRNIDEPIMLHYFGASDVRVIDKDLITLWSEPYINFGIWGAALFVMFIELFRSSYDLLKRNSSKCVYVWVLFVNVMLSHQSMSATLGIIYCSFIFLLFIERITKSRY